MILVAVVLLLGVSTLAVMFRSIAVALVLAAGCSTSPGAKPPHPVVATVPGATNPAVTQATIHSTICVPGWTSTVRPPQTTTEAIKRKLYTDEHLSGGLAAWELDHEIALDIGGAPNDPRNFWMQPIAQAKTDDQGIEIQYARDVCAGRTTLAAAQKAMVDWKHSRG